MNANNRGGFGNLVWVRDNDGKEYACSADALRDNHNGDHNLSDQEKAGCIDVNTIVGTERW